MEQKVRTAIVINAIPKMDRFEDVVKYFANLYDIFQKHGGTNIQKLRTSEQLTGNAGFMATAIIEFPDSDAIHGALSSKELSALDNAHETLYEVFDMRICEMH